MIIKANKFILRSYRKGDEKSLVENINDKNVSKFMSTVPFPYKLKDARFWINRSRKLENKKIKNEIHFAIDITGKVVGGIGLMHIEKAHKAEIGYWIGRNYWNIGIMTNVVKLMSDFGFKKLKLKRIYAKVFLKNKASAKVLEKNGFRLEGLMRKEMTKKDKLYDAYLYSKLK